jgi:hypothetical protein
MVRNFLFRFLIFFVSLFIIFEIICRIFIDPVYFERTNLYSQVNEKDTVDYIFIGTSRTAASIVPEVFGNDSHKIAVNAGRGYSTSQTQYRALRFLLRRNPDVLKNCAVFLEAPMGICYTENGRIWIYESYAYLLIPYMDQKDLFEFLLKAEDPVRTKTDVVLLYGFASWRDCFYIREKMDRRVKYYLGKITELSVAKKTETQHNSNMQEKGGIRQDSISVKVVRKLAHDVVPEVIKSQTPLSLSDMDDSMLNRINQLVTGAGGRVYLFDSPLSSVIQKIYETDLAKANKKVFDLWIDQKGIPVIKASFGYSDEDFPDLFHLRASRAEEYTDSLLNAYQIQVNSNLISSIIEK